MKSKDLTYGKKKENVNKRHGAGTVILAKNLRRTCIDVIKFENGTL
jgi:hypothetical protein